MGKKWPESKSEGMYPWFIVSLLLHGLIIPALFLSFSLSQPEKKNIVVSVKLTDLQEKIKQKTPALQQQKAPEVKNSPEQKQIAAPEEASITAAREKRQKEKQRKEKQAKLALQKKQREAWLKKLAARKANEEKANREKKAREKLAEEEKRAKQLAEKKEAERLAKQAALKKLQQAARDQLQQMREKQEAEARAAATRLEQLLARYKSMIRKQISQSWQRPLSTVKSMQASVKLTLAPTGEIINITLLKSSGNDEFDRSVLDAIRIAAPFRELYELDMRVFESHFRNLYLNFTPQDLLV